MAAAAAAVRHTPANQRRPYRILAPAPATATDRPTDRRLAISAGRTRQITLAHGTSRSVHRTAAGGDQRCAGWDQ